MLRVRVSVLRAAAALARVRSVAAVAQTPRTAVRAAMAPVLPMYRPVPVRSLHSTAPLAKVVSFPLADIGEGIAEVEILEWCACVPG